MFLKKGYEIVVRARGILVHAPERVYFDFTAWILGLAASSRVGRVCRLVVDSFRVELVLVEPQYFRGTRLHRSRFDRSIGCPFGFILAGCYATRGFIHHRIYRLVIDLSQALPDQGLGAGWAPSLPACPASETGLRFEIASSDTDLPLGSRCLRAAYWSFVWWG